MAADDEEQGSNIIDPEWYFERRRRIERLRSPEEEMVHLNTIYRDATMKWPQRNCSAWAELTVWELMLMQRKETMKWDSRTRHERIRLRACLRWLHRVGVRDIEYEEVVGMHWEDLACILYLWQDEGLQVLFPNLTAEVFF